MKMAWQRWGPLSPWPAAEWLWGCCCPFLHLEATLRIPRAGMRRREVEVTCLHPRGLEGRAFSLIFSTVCFSMACWIETLNIKITQCSENSPSSSAAAVSWWRLFRPYRNGDIAPKSLFLTSTMTLVVYSAVCGFNNKSLVFQATAKL